MASTLRPIGHDDQLSLVEHLDELRTRVIVSAVFLAVAFAVCFWRSDAILDLVNRPLAQAQRVSQGAADPLERAGRFEAELGQALATTAPALRDLQASIDLLAQSASLSEAQRADLRRRAASVERALAAIREAAAAVPPDRERQPVTLGAAEPFTTTISVSMYAAILISLPLLLYQAYAFVLPAFSPAERRVVIPLMALVPMLFVGGVVFAYLLVLPRAIAFLQTFNDDSFDILLQARDYYRFSVVLLGGIGLMFQMPVAVLAMTRSGLVSPAQLRANRGYVILGMAIVAAVVTPTPDPVTMGLAMGPLVLLFELSILLAAWFDRRARPREAEDPPDDTEDDRTEPIDAV